jgi:hypothetical protein
MNNNHPRAFCPDHLISSIPAPATTGEWTSLLAKIDAAESGDKLPVVVDDSLRVFDRLLARLEAQS